MKKVFFALILSILILDVNLVWAEDSLERYKKECRSIIEKPSIKITSSYGKLVYNHEKDQNFLIRETYRNKNIATENFSKGFSPAGLTKVNTGFKFNVRVGVVGVSHDYVCLYPEKIDAHLGYLVPIIYISKDLDRNSCKYALVMRHEKTHMQIYIEALDYFLPEFKRTVESLPDIFGVDIVKKSEQTDENIGKYANKYKFYLQSKVREWMKQVLKEQNKLDTIENYMLESKLCEEIDGY